jgi:hypothetical protein
LADRRLSRLNVSSSPAVADLAVLGAPDSQTFAELPDGRILEVGRRSGTLPEHLSCGVSPLAGSFTHPKPDSRNQLGLNKSSGDPF